jgi:hypothetical protein
VTNVNEVADAGMEFDDADHALRLMRDLANKGLILEQRPRRSARNFCSSESPTGARSSAGKRSSRTGTFTTTG